MMKRILVGLACVMAGAAQTPPLPLEVRVLDETVPPGQAVQLKLALTDPRPISTGSMGLDALDPTLFGDVLGVALFSDLGDVAGAALVRGGLVSAQFATDPRFTTDPKLTFGQSADYPLMTVVVRTNPNVAVGTKTQVTINPGASFWTWLGQSYPGTVKPGTVTVGGSLSVSNVVPGAGLLPAGSIVKLLGSGFDPSTTVAVDVPAPPTVQYVSPGEIDLKLVVAMDMQGKRIRVKNKDGSLATYFSYLRATPVGASSRLLLNQTTPIFTNALAGGFLPLSPAGAPPGSYTGLALQNANQSAAKVTLDVLSAAGQVLTSTTVPLPSGARYVRDLTELFGLSALQVGSGVRVTPDAPIQMLGLIGNDTAHTVTPVILSAAAPPAVQLTASPQALSFNYKVGDPQPAALTLTLTTGGGAIPFSVTQSPQTGWLTVSPTTGTAPATLAVTANPSGLAPGTYTTTLSVTPSTGSAAAIQVALTITDPNTPLINAIVNAANQQIGALSPGEIITLYGRFPGVAPAGLTLDSAGRVASSLSGVRVLFDGFPAPLTFVSPTQINAIVPYEIADGGNTRVQAEVSGALSPVLPQPVTPSAPAVFTADSSGFGPAAALNPDFSLNSAANPIARRSVITIYATGEGRTSPPGVTGSVAGSDLKRPVLDVSATIGGQPADVGYAGSAPSLVAGVLQMNITVPDSAPSGSAVPIVIKVGSAISASGVTIAVQ